jgi:hypothetical protein
MQYHSTIFSKYWALGQGAEIYNVETYTATQGLEVVINFYCSRHVDNIYICLNSLEVAA